MDMRVPADVVVGIEVSGISPLPSPLPAVVEDCMLRGAAERPCKCKYKTIYQNYCQKSKSICRTRHWKKNMKYVNLETVKNISITLCFSLLFYHSWENSHCQIQTQNIKHHFFVFF